MYKLSYFSYKGGSGRSSVLVNTIPFLAVALDASPQHPIILIDMDIDSAGLTYLLGKENEAKSGINVQSIFRDGTPGGNNFNPTLENHTFFKQLFKVGKKMGLENDGTILLLPASDGISANSSNNYDISKSPIDKLTDLLEAYECKAVVYDTAAGDQVTASISNQCADTIVTCMRPTNQFREGTHRYIERLSKNVKNKNIVIVPNAVSTEDIWINKDRFPLKAKIDINNMFKNIDSDNNICLQMVSGDNFGIPLVNKFLWSEDILYRYEYNELKNDEKAAYEMYKYLVKIICDFKEN